VAGRQDLVGDLAVAVQARLCAFVGAISEIGPVEGGGVTDVRRRQLAVEHVHDAIAVGVLFRIGDPVGVQVPTADAVATRRSRRAVGAVVTVITAAAADGEQQPDDQRARGERYEPAKY
jgi:hypothetical protein